MSDNSLIERSIDLIYPLRPGNVYDTIIKKTVTDKLGEPYNACDDNTNALESPLAKEIEARGSEYSQRLCFNLCILHFIEKECACSLRYQLWTNGSDTCRSECVGPILDSFDYHEKCKECPFECDSVVFEKTSEKMVLTEDCFFSDDIKKILNSSVKFSNLTFDNVLKNLLILNLRKFSTRRSKNLRR